MSDNFGGILIIAIVLAVVFTIASALLGALIGAFLGWIIGFTPLGTWILEFLRALGVDGVTTVHLGTTCGFIGGFFSSHVNYKG